MKLLRLYLKQRWRGISVAFGSCGIFVVTFWLYHLPVAAVLYPTAVCTILGLVLLAIDFRRVLRKHQKLARIQTLSDAIGENFPEIEGLEDADYQQIIRLLHEEQTRFHTDTARRYEDMVDYYTIWAHQIKTPIASMRLTLQNEDTALSRKLSGDLFRIEQYVEMVLMFLRLDSDSTDYVIREQDLDVIVRQAVRKFAGEFIARRLQLVYEPIHTKVITDEKWLSFVIEQVLSNALKYTPSGSITISLEAPKILCIRDTDMGIAPEDLPRIFEKGYTGYHGRADKKASGIGLYLCKRVCSNLGHRISAESDLDFGTVIRIDLSQYKLSAE
ncbi:MAG: sensor histidine kinase [Oscillospiraceae bacterium]|nr:sensor histidine kinase [Oscillospiraceae bacterium]